MWIINCLAHNLSLCHKLILILISFFFDCSVFTLGKIKMVSILRNVKILSFDKYMKLKKNKKQKHKQKVSECINWQVEGLEMGIQTF